MTAGRVYHGSQIGHHQRVLVESEGETVPLPRLEHRLSDKLAWGKNAGTAVWELARCLLADVLGDTAICQECGGSGMLPPASAVAGTARTRVPADYLSFELGCSCDRGLTVTFAVYYLFSEEALQHLPAGGWELNSASIQTWLARNSPWTPLAPGLIEAGAVRQRAPARPADDCVARPVGGTP